MTATLAYPATNTVGESIVWDDRNHRLLWVDIVAKTIHSLDPRTQHHQCWQTPDFVTSIGLRKDGGAIVGLMKTICLWDFGEQFEPLADIETDKPANRLNEGVVGPDGAFWIGTMQNNIASDGSPLEITASTGYIYKCSSDGQVDRLSDDSFGITNTFIWSKGRVVTADSLANTMYSYAMDAKNIKLSDRKQLLVDFERGLPDGSCIDAQGFIWNCRVVGGACLVRMSTEGVVDRVVELPCSWPTSCTFGGEQLDTLYITSARFTMSAEHLAAHPHEGALFALDVGVTGRYPYRFGSGDAYN